MVHQSVVETTRPAATEGSIAIELQIEDGVVADVSVQSTRRVDVARWLAGRGHQEVQRAVGLLFPTCGMAHRFACARAIADARGRGRSAQIEAMRDTILLAEAAVSHVWQLALAWPRACSAPSDTVRVREARCLAQQIRYSLLESSPDGQALQRPDWALARLSAEMLATLVRDLATRQDDPLVAAVIAANRASFGQVARSRATALDSSRAGELLASNPSFARCPEMDGPVDVSAYGRLASARTVRQAEESFGAGLLTRLIARRVDAQTLANHLPTTVRSAQAAADDRSADHPAGGEGVGSAMTGRGPLHYWVRVGEHAVEDLRVVAPTDWTFHPRGVLYEALLGREATSTLVRDADWLVMALDPCVPWTVEVRGA